MKKSLFSTVCPISDPSSILHWKRKKCLAFTSLLLVLMLSSNYKAQSGFQIFPGTNGDDGVFLGPYSNVARRFQMLINYAPISLLAGKNITSISFRLPNSYTNSWPSSNALFGSYEVYLSNGVTPANMQMNFAGNITGTQTMVKSGNLAIPTGAVHGGNSTDPYSYSLVFDTPYFYSGGNLLIEIRHTGNNSTEVASKAVYTNSTGYGTYFSACWQQGTNVVIANFPFVKINVENKLGVESVTLDNELSIFPNPVKDNLYVKSSEDINEFHVIDTAGRKVLSQKNTLKLPQLTTESLSKGVYILQIIYKNGNSTSTRFVKE